MPMLREDVIRALVDAAHRHCQVDEDGVVFPLEAKVLALDQPAQVTASQTWNARLRSHRW